MGFMGLDHWMDSDNAADFHYSLQRAHNARNAKKAVRYLVNQEVKDDANDYNTPGCVNIALVMEVEGRYNADVDETTPKFSHLLTVTQLRRIHSKLQRCRQEWGWEWTSRLTQLRRMVYRRIQKRGG